VKIAIVNYGMGNLASVRRALEDIGTQPYVADCPAAMYEANRIVLPGVGAFSQGMQALSDAGWVDALHDVVTRHNKPLLGICLGMQMLASAGDEGGSARGLGFVPGRIERLDTLGCHLRLPHVGWNEVAYRTNDPFFSQIPDGSDFYFVHSYALVPEQSEHVLAATPYDCDLVSVVRNRNIFGCQFHPEKSSKAGRQLLKNFVSYVPC
jgi:imidazole glycerol-phosphate synthase subunit HisH